ncbi:MAG: 4Fe-4S ferredoxin [Deltaproteobacteria bacterium]|nr:4Fe-4S ferredoxin [Deltaproteobacteria bacterium]
MDPKVSDDNPAQPGAQAGMETEEPPGEKKQYEIDIFPDWCKACGICAAFCPRQCITQDAEGRPVIADRERCTGCRWCELHCPDFAICVKELVSKEGKPEEAD